MKVGIIHLSDIHLKNEDNHILSKVQNIYSALRNELIGIEEIFLIISGDVAFSGLEKEYEVAIDIIDTLQNQLFDYLGKKFKVLMIPGNHDCDLKSNSIRDLIIKNLKQNGLGVLDESMIAGCCEVQKNFFEFDSLYSDNDCQVYTDKLLRIFRYSIGDYTLIFNMYNTAWVSQLEENAGGMCFPITRYSEEIQKYKGDISISILHHPFQWIEPDNAREFRTQVENTSDLILTGHEHVDTASLKRDFKGNYTEYIEGGVLQENWDPNVSKFNLILLDLGKKAQNVVSYEFEKDIYNRIDVTNGWVSYVNKLGINKTRLLPNTEFQNKLNDPGATFSHPRKAELLLEDIYVFPDLGVLKFDEKDRRIKDVINSLDIINNIKERDKYLITGEEKSGKSTMCKVLYRHYINNDYVPVLIEGAKIKSTNIDEFNKLVHTEFGIQYDGERLEEFKQLDRLKKVLIIDDFDKCKINSKYKHILLNRINQFYENIVIMTNDLFKITDVLYEDGDNVFQNYNQYEFRPFGHYLRNELITKWNNLGQVEFLGDDELIRKNDKTTHHLNTIIGSNYVPSYPIFLLVILQTLESGIPHNLSESSYGYYYDLLITQALGKIDMNNEQIDAYSNYIKELSYYFFKENIIELTKEDLKTFHYWFCQEYDLIHDFEAYLQRLLKASILENTANNFKFKYKYIYYYFVAKYLSNNIHDVEIRKLIEEMCKKLYIEEYANILMFLTHLSKDPFIIAQVLKQAEQIFKGTKSVQLDDDVKKLNGLIGEIPKLVIKNREIQENRKEVLIRKDSIEQEQYEFDGNIQELEDEIENESDLVAQLNLSFKTIEIIGQILKNYYGSIKAGDKINLCQEAYLLGLRSLNMFLATLAEDTDAVVQTINAFIEEKGLVEEEKIEETSKKILFNFCSAISYHFIKKVSNSVGTDNLTETFKKVLDKHNSIAINLIDISIKLDYFTSFPFNDIRNFKNRINGNVFATILLRYMARDYLYMFNVNYDDKQRICNMLGLSLEEQRLIDAKMAKNKLTI
ncbi:STAND family AAA ATPase [Bacillus thuringiensis]|uniref:STAND family AAA ATPase n=1 Tax=Bacillus thuringiensis TaxID=1428 RepID=UPI001298E9CC|nr:metallophosphoesterase [Bacillus thuringiensis]MEB9915099.1 metallophosphoesterase [Bacillus cereus]MCR6790249.1 metallophosphoesterase [Bacillus thuringiensis]MCR6820724.1 metallophosphoesterase [Bacillus thuringiensis]MCR6831881.1 metallophosphoesterase [Bacillus thuringiensis]MEC3214407.1 metallophosphoesterase [Bacillus cereus]